MRHEHHRDLNCRLLDQRADGVRPPRNSASSFNAIRPAGPGLTARRDPQRLQLNPVHRYFSAILDARREIGRQEHSRRS
jgi:hypothetical protein